LTSSTGRTLPVKRVSVPQTTTKIELCLRLTNGKPALACWIGDVETEFG
jgi:hypothetical protein